MPPDERRWIVYRDKIAGRVGRWQVAEPGREPVVDQFREKVEVMPVQPAGPDTVEERLRRALPGAGEGSVEERQKFHDLVRIVEAREGAVAAVGPVGRPECSCDTHGESYGVDDRCPVHGVGRSCEVTDEMVLAGARALQGVHGWRVGYWPEQVARAVLEAALRTTAPAPEGGPSANG